MRAEFGDKMKLISAVE